MRVLCINSFYLSELKDIVTPPEIGKIYTVISKNNEGWYRLAEIVNTTTYSLLAWDPLSFIILDNTNNGRPIDSINKPSYSNAPTSPPVIVGIPGT